MQSGQHPCKNLRQVPEKRWRAAPEQASSTQSEHTWAVPIQASSSKLFTYRRAAPVQASLQQAQNNLWRGSTYAGLSLATKRDTAAMHRPSRKLNSASNTAPVHSTTPQSIAIFSTGGQVRSSSVPHASPKNPQPPRRLSLTASSIRRGERQFGRCCGCCGKCQGSSALPGTPSEPVAALLL